MDVIGHCEMTGRMDFTFMSWKDVFLNEMHILAISF